MLSSIFLLILTATADSDEFHNSLKSKDQIDSSIVKILTILRCFLNTFEYNEVSKMEKTFFSP